MPRTRVQHRDRPEHSGRLPHGEGRVNRIREAGRRQVLLVNGSRDEREVYASWLRHCGYCTLQASSAADGFRLAVELCPSIAIVDLGSHQVDDGLALTRRIKHSGETRNIVVVIMTNHLGRASHDAAWRAGCDAFLTKPCTPDQLEAEIVRLMTAAASHASVVSKRHSTA